VRFLLDENLSPRLAELLTTAGHDAVHARDLSLGRAPDELILDAARRDGRVVISADADFGEILARMNAGQPSVVFLRRQQGRRATEVAALIIANLDTVADDLLAGAIVVIDDYRIRVRSLPMNLTDT
jgi:predicted nuclease of predicted toxin-antitoxin system